MGGRSPSGVGAIIALGLTLLLPAHALAEEEGETVTGFRLHATNGYELSMLAGLPAEEEEAGIGVFLGRENAIVSYAVPATVSPTTIEADLGKLGKISVRRVRTRRTKTVRFGCEQRRKRTVPAERYEGTIEFHGEEGFADVSATSVPALIGTFCYEERRPPMGESPSGVRLDVAKRRPGGYRLEFDAVRRRAGARTGVRAELVEHRDEIEIHRATWLWAGASILRYDQSLRIATVRPPAPFAGLGRFRRGGRHGIWRGNLTVDLPGRSDVPISGRGFWANLEHPRRSALAFR
jgi:hypothetical protein